MLIKEMLTLGVIFSRDADGQQKVIPVQVTDEDGRLLLFLDDLTKPETAIYVPLPYPSFGVYARVNDGSFAFLGHKIPGAAPIDWDALANEAEQNRQDKRSREHERKS